jgi:hypothetical protein
MSLNLFNGIEQYLVQSFGSIYILALGLVLFFTVAFLIAGVDFRLIILLNTILVIGFSRMGWIPAWIEGAFWILIVGLGLYMLWIKIFER